MEIREATELDLDVILKIQKEALGSKLIQEGLELLSKSGVELVFVLGYPDYYSRHQFTPAGIHGLEAPYPIPEKNADAWMVRQLHPGLIGKIKGKVQCANALNKPEYWRE
jgi:putative acetyltransferase